MTAIYVLPPAWGAGGGHMLMERGLRSLRDAGFKSATLWVLDSNVRVRHFYEAGGWTPDGAKKIDDRGDFQLVELRYRRGL